MNNFLLYASTVFIWGTTWLGIKFQLGSVDPMISVTYRFTAAAAILFFYCKLHGLNMRFNIKAHLFMALQGVLLFGLNYWLVYLAEVYITSGLVAVVFSTLVFMNIVNGTLFLGSPIRLRVVAGAAVGLAGIGLVFWPEIKAFSLSDKAIYGSLLGLLGTFMASLGNITSARNQKYRLPVIQSNAFGMAYGAVSVCVVCLISGKGFTFDPSFAYIASLIYLSVFGSIVAFGCYLTLVGRIGADRASYASMLFPLVALGISTLFEGYQWSVNSLTGMFLVLFGNVWVLHRRGRSPSNS